MRKGTIKYNPMPDAKRFWVYSENCYSEEELTLRQWIIKARANSGIHPDYLTTSNSWFADDSQALINTNEHSWFYANSFKPRHVFSRDDFHVQPIDSQRLQWPALYELMQKTGDYLLIRNEKLSEEHLNQPMNFVLLDINTMLKALSQNPNINQVKDQLELITKYVRTIEKNVSPLIGSDRLFLANFRGTIDVEIHPQLTHKIESQLLRDRLQDLSKTINKISADRNRILHFALNVNPANPHPYGFSTHLLEDTKAYPTHAAKECGQPGTEVSSASPSLLIVTAEQLRDCPNFKLISMDEETLNHYSAAVTDLNELERFQNVITQTIDLLGQAGEVYTIHQFKEQMLDLLKQIDGFIDDSSVHIEQIIRTNDLAYHEAIQAEQKLPFWKNWLTSEKIVLKTYIKNQDTLAQFPSSSPDLEKTNKLLKENVNQVIGHLSQPKGIETSFEAIAGKAQELNSLMGSMHSWIRKQYLIKGLEAPKAPEPLRLLVRAPQLIMQESVITPTAPPISHYEPLFAPKAITVTPCDPNDPMCSKQECNATPTPNINLTLGFLALAPIGILVLYLIMKRHNKNPEPVLGTEDEFTDLKVQIDDILTQIAFDADLASKEFKEQYEEMAYQYSKLIKKAQNKQYDVEELNQILDEVTDLFNEFVKPDLSVATTMNT